MAQCGSYYTGVFLNFPSFEMQFLKCPSDVVMQVEPESLLLGIQEMMSRLDVHGCHAVLSYFN